MRLLGTWRSVVTGQLESDGAFIFETRPRPHCFIAIDVKLIPFGI